jgi:hypothetical protein
MTNQENVDRSPSGPEAGGPAPLVAPNIRPEELQRLVDQAAHFNVFSVPDYGDSHVPIVANGKGEVTGLNICESLHRFRLELESPTSQEPLRARKSVGEVAGQFTHRWMGHPG